MATVTHAGTTSTTTAGDKTVAATPAVGDLIVIVCNATGVNTTAVTDNNAGGLGTYTKVDVDRTGFSTAGTLNIWIRDALVGSATATTYTATQTTSTGGGLSVFSVAGMTRTGATAVRSSGGQSTGTAVTTPAPVLGLTPDAANPIIAAVANGTSSSTTVTERTGYTEATDSGFINPPTGFETCFLNSGETSATLTFGSTTATTFASIAVELDTSAITHPSRVNNATISGSGTAATAYNVTGSPGLLAGDLLVVTVDCNGTHAANGMSVTLAGETFFTISETDQGGASSRWIQTFYCVLSTSQKPVPSVTPYALNTASTAVMDVYRGTAGTISRAVQITSGATGLTATNPALATAPPAGDLVLTLTGVSSGTATPPAAFTLGSQASTGGPTVSNAYVLADGASTFGGTWTWGTSNSSALQTVAFAAAAGSVVAPPASPAMPGQTWKRHFKHRQTLLPQTVTAAAAVVTFDASASQSGSSVSTINWLHVCTGSSLVLLVDVAVGVISGPDSMTTSVTYNSVAMTSLGKVHANNTNVGYVERFALVGPATGSHSVVVTVSASVTSLIGGSMSFAGANQTLASYTTTTAFGNSTTATVTAVSPPTGSFVMGGHGAGTGFSAVGNTSRYNVTNTASTGCGNLAGNTAAGAGSNIAMTATVSGADFWASLATIIPIPSGGGPNNFNQALNGSLSFTSAQNTATSKGVSAALSFTSSQARAIATHLAGALSFTGSLTTAVVHFFTQALNASLSFTSSQSRSIGTHLSGALSFTGSQARAVGKRISAGLAFTSSQPRAVRSNLAGALSFTGAVTKRTAKNLGTATLGFTGSLTTAAVHFFTQAFAASLSFTSSQSRSIGTHLSGAVSFTGSLPRRTAKGITGGLSFTSSQARAVRTHLVGALSFTSTQTRRTAKNLGTAALGFTGSLATQAVHFFTQAFSASLSFTGSLATHRIVVKALTATLSFTSSQTKRTATSFLAGLSFTGSQTKRIAKTISAALGLTGLLAALSSAQPTTGTASAAQMSVPDSTPGSSTAPTSGPGDSTGPTSSAP